jgi:hypothetical protein
MKNYRLYNNLTGWIVFIIAALVYLSTIEPTSSLWDCGEFIASAYKLEVGHPPGAPLFMLVGRLFSLFAGNNVEKVAMMINSISALASAFTILFLFWTITHLARKILVSNNNLNSGSILAIIGSGLVGALAYTFSDTFWFSAVEGEVYASSSLFTAGYSCYCPCFLLQKIQSHSHWYYYLITNLWFYLIIYPVWNNSICR